MPPHLAEMQAQTKIADEAISAARAALGSHAFDLAEMRAQTKRADGAISELRVLKLKVRNAVTSLQLLDSRGGLGHDAHSVLERVLKELQ